MKWVHSTYGTVNMNNIVCHTYFLLQLNKTQAHIIFKISSQNVIGAVTLVVTAGHEQ